MSDTPRRARTRLAGPASLAVFRSEQSPSFEDVFVQTTSQDDFTPVARQIVASLFVLGYWHRERRLGVWKNTPLMFEDEFPDQPLQLQL